MAHDDELKVDTGGFWADKTPCWDIRGCVAQMCRHCPAYMDQSRPCWQTQGTLCKELLQKSTCFVCEVFERHGGSEEAVS